MTTHTKLSGAALVLGLLAGSACSYDIANPNAPNVIGENPNRSEVVAASLGLLVATRSDLADFVRNVGILGREAYRFDGSDPRFTGELMRGPLDAGGRAFGGNHWNEEYAAIRSGNDLLRVIGTSTFLSAEEQSAVTGYVRTMQAYNFLLVLDTHTQDSIPIDVGTDVTAPPAAFRSNADAFAHVAGLLDSAVTELQAGGSAFPFTLPRGFSGFNTPATFILFNRALRARVAVYRGDFTGALGFLAQSFYNPTVPVDLNLGVYMDFSAGPGDLANPLAIDPLTGENFGHPSLEAQAQLQQPSGQPDQRFLDKLVKRPTRSAGAPQLLTSDLGWTLYPSPNSPIPIIRNEELILLHAEASLGLSDLPTVVNDLNLVRTSSGLLPPYAGAVDAASLHTELLYNRRYSLMYEGGHSWIDFRRFGRLADLATNERPGPPPDVIFTTLPIPTAEVQAHQ